MPGRGCDDRARGAPGVLTIGQNAGWTTVEIIVISSAATAMLLR